jgi:hypothetical protein
MADDKREQKETFIDKALSKGKTQFKKDDIESNTFLFNDICKDLTGEKVNFDTENIKHLLASIQSLKEVDDPLPGSRFSKYKWKKTGEGDDEPGWYQKDFFIVYLRCLIEAYFNYLLVSKDHTSAALIKDEMLTLLKVIITDSLNEKALEEIQQGKDYAETAKKHIDFITKLLDSLKNGNTLLSHASIPKHSFYILYYEANKKLYAAIHNLGSGCGFYAEKDKDGVIKSVPTYTIEINDVFKHLFEVFYCASYPHSLLLDSQDNYHEPLVEQLIQRIYFSGTNLSLLAGELPQASGNCVVKNYLHAMLTRLGKDKFNALLRILIGTLNSNIARIDKGIGTIKPDKIKEQLSINFANYDPFKEFILHGRARDVMHSGSYGKTWWGSDSDVEIASTVAGLFITYQAYQAVKKEDDDAGLTLLKLSGAALAGYGSSYAAQKALQGAKDNYLDPTGNEIIATTSSSSSYSLLQPSAKKERGRHQSKTLSFSPLPEQPSTTLSSSQQQPQRTPAPRHPSSERISSTPPFSQQQLESKPPTKKIPTPNQSVINPQKSSSHSGNRNVFLPAPSLSRDSHSDKVKIKENSMSNLRKSIKNLIDQLYPDKSQPEKSQKYLEKSRLASSMRELRKIHETLENKLQKRNYSPT